MPRPAQALIQCTCTLLPYPHPCTPAVKRKHELGQSREDRDNARTSSSHADVNAQREHPNGPEWQEVAGFNDAPMDVDDHPLLEEEDEEDNLGYFAQKVLLTVENKEGSDSGGDESDMVGEELEDDEELIVDPDDTLPGNDCDEWEMTRLQAMEGVSHKKLG